MKLYLVRHGEAVSQRVNTKRPLSERGTEDIRRMADFLKKKNVNVDIIFHSGKKRAEQTAEIIKNAINPSAQFIEKDCLNPDDSTDAIHNEISDMKKDCMIVGHLPFMSHLTSRLVTGSEENEVMRFMAGGICALEKIQGIWKIMWSASSEDI